MSTNIIKLKSSLFLFYVIHAYVSCPWSLSNRILNFPVNSATNNIAFHNLIIQHIQEQIQISLRTVSLRPSFLGLISCQKIFDVSFQTISIVKRTLRKFSFCLLLTQRLWSLWSLASTSFLFSENHSNPNCFNYFER